MIDSNIRKMPTVLAAAGLAVALVLGSALNPTPTFADKPPHSHGGDGDTSGGKIAIMATFRDVGVDDVEDRIRSDCATGLCPYVDKVNNVRATLGSANGNFNLTIGKPKPNQMGRGLVLDFSDCDSGPCNVRPTCSSPGCPAHLLSSGVDLRTMDQPDQVPLNLRIPFEDEDGTEFTLRFNPSRCEGSSDITVTRTDADTWEIEAAPNDLACLETSLGGGATMLHGLFHMPFLIEVEAL